MTGSPSGHLPSSLTSAGLPSAGLSSSGPPAARLPPGGAPEAGGGPASGPARAILIIEDEAQIRRFLVYALEAAGYQTREAASGQAALAALQAGLPDLVILDLGLPDMEGRALLAAIRRVSRLPVIVLSAQDAEAERIALLDLGADDFIPKPFGIGELLARLRLHFRLRGVAARAAPGEWGRLRIDPERREVTLAGVPVKLTRKEFDLAWLLAQNEGRILTHRALLERIWGPAHGEDIPYLRVFIGQLRRKLGVEPGRPVQIRTEAGIGYQWVSGEEEAAPSRPSTAEPRPADPSPPGAFQPASLQADPPVPRVSPPRAEDPG